MARESTGKPQMQDPVRAHPDVAYVNTAVDQHSEVSGSVTSERADVRMLPPGTWSVSFPPPDTQRHCGYSRCGNELEYDGRGRPPTYCPDRRWQPGNKTCKQMAAAERDAVRMAGLDTQLDAYDASTGRLIAAAGPLHERLGELIGEVVSVRNGALVRVGEAEREMAEALDRAEQADRTAQRARNSEAAAQGRAVQAEREAHDARQQLQQVRHDAEVRVTAALDRVSVVEREHGQALARAHAAEAGRHEATQRREAAEQRTADLEAQLQRVRDAHGELNARIAAAEQRFHGLQVELLQTTARAERAETLAAARASELDVVTARLTDERDAAEARAGAATDALAESRAEQDDLRRQLAEAAAAARAATERAERAETRHDQLVTTLSTMAHHGAAPEGDPA